VDASVRIGPYVVVDGHVTIGPGCELGPYVYVTGVTKIGPRNRFFAGCVIGEAPQDLKYRGEPTGLEIGADNVFREHVTVHRSTKKDESTLIGSQCFLMANSHVAHNCHLGDGVILANGALLGGHASIGDRVFISGNCLVHQFVRVGTLALMQGGSAISQDLPPYTIAHRGNSLCGLNTVGLRRAGFSTAERQELKQLYRALFRSGVNLQSALAGARRQFFSAPAKILLEFVASSKRGVCPEIGDGQKRDEELETEAF
jgi:UDP-N-acetylglucosamine acyltransferase